MKNLKRGISLLLTLTLCFLCMSVGAEAAVKWPATSNIKTYVISTKNDTTVYKTATSSAKYGTIYASNLITIKGYSGSRLKVTYPVSGTSNYKMGWIDKDNQSSGSWQWPVSNYIVVQSFGNKANTRAGRPHHAGIDLVNSVSRDGGNPPIYAAAAGKVKYRGYESGNGYHVILQHSLNGQTVYSLYSHLSSYNDCPDVGKSVGKGQKIGTMGTTGASTGTHYMLFPLEFRQSALKNLVFHLLRNHHHAVAVVFVGICILLSLYGSSCRKQLSHNTLRP